MPFHTSNLLASFLLAFGVSCFNRFVHLCDLSLEEFLGDVPLKLKSARHQSVVHRERLAVKDELFRFFERTKVLLSRFLHPVFLNEILQLLILTKLRESARNA